MKTAEEILEKYVEIPFRHTKIVEKDNALIAMEEYANQFKPKPIGYPSEPKKELTQENCPHPSHRVRENISGGRFDECLDCGKTWG